ncbi:MULTISPECIES: DNA polymerase/3'-5' exonuclease PolX [Caldilinea]|jgi:DNA polymerase (family 10)|uniref:DNA polymerase beta n=1 Tax=Caldilinea aerophila (strain DSM 14535 / JCM 11387 / NBRC 104270 / STL-6-O1) TaxID=926550 RepID=I0I8F4_CALAS|nr:MULTISPECIES: DNA polymerase/3'-5' exonuclease PolX [Caldilinea]MBO9391755.1 DNA polymerase/3'-5' exonuclease PolX [Caldilinea sp.]BAM01542.1 DNA polymerase X family protein [Caldilinea aerophila DSM 14535 = NBRC 104270]GIV72879.1 MAG: DNA polymerase/3'-5' exonuclease PolX [Caldilinea sp.]
MDAKPRLTNRDVAAILAGVAARLQILDANRFRVIAFQNAAESIRNLPQDINALDAAGELTSIPGVGKGIAEALHNLLTTGSDPEFDALFAQVPQGVVEMMQVPDMGPKKARRLWEELGIDSVEALRAAAEAGKLRSLKGFGPKSEEKILKGIELLVKRTEQGTAVRMPLGLARPLALRLIAELQERLPAVALERIEIVGSLRRWKETIGDVDILCVSAQPASVMEAFRSLPEVADVVGAGETKSSVVLGNGLQVDLRVVERKHWGAALQYFTGSKEHNVALREIALKQGWSLNEYGLTATGDGEAPAGEQRFFEEEAELYAFLGLEWIPPELREHRGEVQAAQRHSLPALITLADLQGELHGHTTWSDGTASVAEMADAARARGYRYWLVSDHSVGLGIVQGVDAEKLRRQRAEIDAYNRRCAEAGIDFRLLQGSEVEILADGSLGLPDEVLAQLDVVVASIHSAQRQDRETITARCLKAIRNPHVDILGHPTGRLIGERPPSEIDMERILQACLETGTIVEINANPARLDVNDIYARRAVELGCKLVINTDAHGVHDLTLAEYGIAVARRGWVTAADVINTRPLDAMRSLLKDAKR